VPPPAKASLQTVARPASKACTSHGATPAASLSLPEVFFFPLPPAEFRSGARSTTLTQALTACARSRRRGERRRQRRAPRARKHTGSKYTRRRCAAREEAAERTSPAHERCTRAREDR
jgi:hypothetical protein